MPETAFKRGWQRDAIIRENYRKMTLKKLAETTGMSMWGLRKAMKRLGIQEGWMTSRPELQKNEETEKFVSVDPLCVSCRYATPLMCKFLAQRGEPEKVSEYGMEWITAVARYGEGGITLVKVIKCNKYKRGPLPVPGKVWKEC